MSQRKRAQRLIKRIPGVDWEDIIAIGIKLLNEELSVEEMYLEEHPNGVSINMKLEDEESKEKAVEFWSQNMGENNDD